MIFQYLFFGELIFGLVLGVRVLVIIVHIIVLVIIVHIVLVITVHIIVYKMCYTITIGDKVAVGWLTHFLQFYTILSKEK